MKKVLLLLSLCIMLLACDKDEPKNNKNHPSTPSQKVEEGIKDEELTAYFGLNKSLTVYQALEKAKTASGAKTIGGREISVTGVSEVSRNEQEGVFSLKVVGTMAGKAFEKVVAFAGFAQKPTDDAMAKRVVATWKSGVDYQKDFDFDTLYRLKDASKFTTGYLAQPPRPMVRAITRLRPKIWTRLQSVMLNICRKVVGKGESRLSLPTKA